MSDPSIRPGDPVPSPLSLSFEGSEGPDADRGDPVHAIVSGEIDVATASTMQTKIDEARRRRATSEVVLDLTGVQFMDSSGLRVIVQLERDLTAERGGLVLVGVGGDVQHILALTGLDSHLSIAETPAEARAILERGRSAETSPEHGG